jgi:hypothetical protein
LIDFRYHLVSIVAVFLALAIGIVLGATALQGDTIDVLRSTNNSLQSHLNDTSAALNSAEQAVSANDSFLQVAEPKLLDGMLAGEKIVLVAEPGAPSGVIDGIQKAAASAGAAITGTIALQPKFNDLSGATRADLSQINSQLATFYNVNLATAADDQTAYQQDAAQVISEAILQKTADSAGLSASDAATVLKSYVDGGYLSYTGNPVGTASVPAGTTAGRATLAVIVTAPASAADGQNDPADEVLLAVAAEFATASAATLVAGPTMDQSASASPVSVLRNSSVSGQVSSVDNADTRVGQITAIWALADQLQGGKPNSYGVSGANQVSPVPSPAPSATASVPGTPSPKPTGKVRKTVSTK